MTRKYKSCEPNRRKADAEPDAEPADAEPFRRRPCHRLFPWLTNPGHLMCGVRKWLPGSWRNVMLWSVNIGSIAGTAIKVHITFLMFLVWIFAAGWASGGPEAATGSLIFVVLLFACVLAHEFGHIFTARAFGVATPDVILLPIGGVARLERIPEKPSEEFLIAIAGPLDVAIALVLMVGMRAHLDAQSLAAVESTSVSLVDRLAEVNLFLALFNLNPAFPMDGGRVLRALLATRLGSSRSASSACSTIPCSSSSRSSSISPPLPRRSWCRCGRCRATFP
jgi:Zn-dependent protease